MMPSYYYISPVDGFICKGVGTIRTGFKNHSTQKYCPIKQRDNQNKTS